MRYDLAKKIWAENDDYASGAQSGNANKTRPPDADIQDGHRPDEQPAAQWDNWFQNYMQARLHSIAFLQFANFTPIALSTLPASNRMSLARSPATCRTIFAGYGIPADEIELHTDGRADVTTVDLISSEGSDTFRARHAATCQDPSNTKAIVAGRNTSDAQKAVWATDDLSDVVNSGMTEITLGAAGLGDPDHAICSADGRFYVISDNPAGLLFAHTITPTGAWTTTDELGIDPTTSTFNFYAASFKGRAIHIVKTGASVEYEERTGASDDFNGVANEVRSSGTVIDCRYSAPLRKYLVLFSDGRIWGADVADDGSCGSWAEESDGSNHTFDQGVLTDFGAVLVTLESGGANHDGTAKISMDLGHTYLPIGIDADNDSSNQNVLYDGVALWFRNGANDWFRSMVLPNPPSFFS